MPKCIFNFELNRRVPNGMHGGVRGGRESLLLDYPFFEKLYTKLKYNVKLKVNLHINYTILKNSKNTLTRKWSGGNI